MELEDRLFDLEKRQLELENKMNNILAQIQSDVAVIKERTMNMNKDTDLKNDILKKDIERNTGRIEKLENSITWLRRTIFGALITGCVSLIVSIILILVK